MSSARTALVIGGAGSFGRQVADALRGEKWNVVTFDSLVGAETGNLTGTLVKADAREAARITRALNEHKAERIYLCTLMDPAKKASPEDVWDHQLGHLMAALQGMKKTSVQQFVVFMPDDEKAGLLRRMLEDISVQLSVKMRIILWSAKDALIQAVV